MHISSGCGPQRSDSLAMLARLVSNHRDHYLLEADPGRVECPPLA